MGFVSSLFLVVVCLMWPCFVAQAQSSALPATPVPSAPLPAATQAAKPSFTLPPETVAAPNGPPPPVPMEDQYCYAPAVGLYAEPKPLTAAQKHQLDLYADLVLHQVVSFFFRRTPYSRGGEKQVLVRFAVMSNGSYDSPIVTATSGRADFDRHALDSVESFASFPPPPEGIPGPVRFCIRFRYNINMEKEHETKPIDLWPPKAAPAQKP